MRVARVEVRPGEGGEGRREKGEYIQLPAHAAGTCCCSIEG